MKQSRHHRQHAVRRGVSLNNYSDIHRTERGGGREARCAAQSAAISKLLECLVRSRLHDCSWRHAGGMHARVHCALCRWAADPSITNRWSTLPIIRRSRIHTYIHIQYIHISAICHSSRSIRPSPLPPDFASQQKREDLTQLGAASTASAAARTMMELGSVSVPVSYLREDRTETRPGRRNREVHSQRPPRVGDEVRDSNLKRRRRRRARAGLRAELRTAGVAAAAAPS